MKLFFFKANLLFLSMISVFTASNAQPVVGSMSGIPNVNSSGAFTYSIPLTIPPGIRSIIPNLAISYNSHAGNGLLGYGWSIEGLSSITRAPSDIYHDGGVNPVDFNSDDVYMLDGSRLVPVSGGYETNVKNFAKITSVGFIGSGPDHFIVEHNNGLVFEYGNTSDSKRQLLAPSPYPWEIHTWLLNNVHDRNGNYMNFTYWNDPVTGDNHISNIKYAGNNTITPSPILPSTDIDFVYGTRPDNSFAFIGGAKIESNYRLDAIEVRHGGILKHKYELNYSVNMFSHLRNVKEIGEGGSTLPVTDFTYGGPTPNFLNSFTSVTYDHGYCPQAADFNGDGFSDFYNVFSFHSSAGFIYPPPFVPPPPSFKMYRNNQTDNFTFVTGGTLPTPSPSPTFYYPRAYNYNNGRETYLHLDYNGDGKDDLITIAYDPLNYYVYLSLTNPSGTGLTAPTTLYTHAGPISQSEQTHLAIGDFVGNGKKQVLIFYPLTVAPPWDMRTYDTYLTGDGFSQSGTFVGHVVHFNTIDYDGDGKDDLYTTTAGSVPLAGWANRVLTVNTLFASTGIPLSGTLTLSWISNYVSYPNKEHRTYFGDFNGDGKTDVLTWTPFPGPGIWHIGYSKGAEGFSPVDITALGYLNNNDPHTSPSDDNYLISDFNGDGKDDIVEIYNDGIDNIMKVYYSKGNNSFDVEFLTLTPSITDIWDGSFIIGDFNGDGQADLMKSGSASTPINNRIIYLHKQDQRHLLKEINKNDNFNPSDGQKMKITYLPVTQDNNYEHCVTPISYPFHELVSGGLKVVTTFENNRTNTLLNYRYRGCVVHKTGLGFRSFERIITDNFPAARQSIQKNDQFSFETVVPVESSSNYHPASAVTIGMIFPYLERKLFTYGEEILPNNIHIIYPKEEIFEDAVNNLHKKTTYAYYGSPGGSTSLNYYGKPDKITIDAGYGTDVSVQEFTYNPLDPQFFNKDEPSRIVTTSTRGSLPSYSRTVEFTYNPQGLVLTKKLDPSSSHQNLVTYTYDGFGNKKTETSVVTLSPSVTGQVNYSADGRFALQSINPAGQIESFVFDDWGNTTFVTSINGLTSTSSYDDFNRLISTVSPTGITNTTDYLWANALTAECPTGIFSIAVRNSVSGISGNSVVFNDYLGRPVRTVTSSFNGTRRYSDMNYLISGNVNQKSLPYFAGSTPINTDFSYDAMGRITSEVGPTGTITCTYTDEISTVAPRNGITIATANTSATPARLKETTTDATGKTIVVSDAGGTSTIKYDYGSHGKVTYTSADGLATNYTYDAYANMINKDAPNKNMTSYTYDNRDRLKTKLDANGVVFQYAYDILDRVTTKIGPDGPYNYLYDGSTGLNTSGKLIHVTGPAIIPYTSPQTSYTFDAFSRIASCTEQINGTSSTTNYSYDTYNRPSFTMYPGGSNIQYLYNAFGYLSNIGAIGFGSLPYTPLWRKNAENVFGQTASESYGLTTAAISAIVLASMTPPAIPMLYNQTNTYNTHGFLTGSQVTGDLGLVKDCSYSFNEPSGDLMSRTDLTRSYIESFVYDNLDRLTAAYGYGPGMYNNDAFEYAPNGNMTKKLQLSPFEWKYDKYAVKEIANTASVIPSFTQTATYMPFDKVKSLTEGSKRIDFFYNPEEQRGMAKYYTGTSLTKTRYYAENYEKTIDALGNTEEICYVVADGKPVAMFVNNGVSTSLKYILTDYLGSITHVLNSSGGIDEERSYDAWGRMRHPGTFSYTSLPPYSFDRGYTAQEHLNGFNVINLNGRLYDPMIARMFSVDPYIGDPNNSQAYNSYSYALNNPMKYTDKDGNIPIIAVALLAGTINFGINEISGKNRTAEYGLKSFGIGAISGVAGAGVGSAVAGSIGFGGAAGGATVGASAGFTSGFVSGAGTSWANGASFGDGALAGLAGGGIGMVTGGISGGILGGLDATRNNCNFWNGNIDEVGGEWGKNAAFLNEEIDAGVKPTATGEIATTPGNPRYGQYGYVRNGGKKAHYGIDYKGEIGDDVYAMYDGKVIQIGGSNVYGPNFVRTSSTINGKLYNVDYGHMSAQTVTKGASINGGNLIGKIGRMGNNFPSVSPTHVHISVWRPVPQAPQGFVRNWWK